MHWLKKYDRIHLPWFSLGTWWLLTGILLWVLAFTPIGMLPIPPYDSGEIIIVIQLAVNSLGEHYEAIIGSEGLPTATWLILNHSVITLYALTMISLLAFGMSFSKALSRRQLTIGFSCLVFCDLIILGFFITGMVTPMIGLSYELSN